MIKEFAADALHCHHWNVMQRMKYSEKTDTSDYIEMNANGWI